MNRRGVSSSKKRDTLGRRQSSDTAAFNGKKSNRQRYSNKTGRLSMMLILIFGVFGWVQWLIAMTHIHNNEHGGARITHLRSPAIAVSLSRQQEEERRIVHQIQLQEHEFNSAIHVAPKQNVFEEDWLGNLMKEPKDECRTLHEWQLPENTPYSCNIIHELALEDVSRILGCGNDRCTVQMHDMEGHSIALKTMRNINHYDQDDYHAGWIDSVVTERLSSSPLVATQYANCGLALVSEIAAEGTLMDHIIVARQHGEYMTPETRLKIAHQVATAVADLHGLDDSIPSVAHNDLCARQFLLVDGVYKLFDFDSASFTKMNKNGTACLERPEHMDDEWDKIKAPEEFHRHARKDLILKYKADVWVLGDIMYYILTKKWVFEGIPREEAKLRMLAGIGSEVDFGDLGNLADHTVLRAIAMAWTQEPEKRPSASEIASFLRTELEGHIGKPDAGKGTVWRVSIPPLPVDYKANYDDFYKNLE